MIHFDNKIVNWPEAKPKYNIALIHPDGTIHTARHDPNSRDNSCGNYPYTIGGSSRPDMRYWRVHTVYPMTCYADRERLGASVKHKRPLYTCVGQAYIVNYDKKLDVFNAIKSNDNSPVILTKSQIDFYLTKPLT